MAVESRERWPTSRSRSCTRWGNRVSENSAKAREKTDSLGTSLLRSQHDDAMRRYEEQYDALKAKLQAVGFIGQGSVQTRRIACGSPTCRCHHDPDARHGPYHYWTRKARGKTVGLKLTEDELGLYREWIQNNRELERLVKEMRRISSRVLALITGRQAP